MGQRNVRRNEETLVTMGPVDLTEKDFTFRIQGGSKFLGGHRREVVILFQVKGIVPNLPDTTSPGI